MFNRLKIGTRISMMLAVLFVLLLVVSTMSLRNLAHNNAGIGDLKSSSAGLVTAQNAMWELRFGVANFMTGNEQARAKILGDEQKWAGIIKDSLASYEALPHTDEEKAALAQLKESYAKYFDSRPRWFELYSSGKTEEAAEWRAKNTNLYGAATVKGFKQLIELQNKRTDAEVEELLAANASSRNVLVSAVVIALVFSALVGYRLVKSVTMPLGEALKLAETVARGDLTSRVTVRGNDEIGQLMRALQHMNDSLVRIVSEVRSGTDTIATASGEIAAGNANLSQRTEEQAGSLQHSAASMGELTTTVRQNADNARQANQLAQAASGVAVKGGEVIGQVVSTMEAINDSARKIVDIIGVIDGIAFQTNILALNAAVEAARAGEQGRGFAVVASEVRNLAQRSASAAKEIKELIGDSVEKVDAGSRLVSQAGSTMDDVVAGVKRVTDIMADITAASLEQSAGIEQVNVSITQMDDITQQNAALVEQASAAAASLQEQAGALAQAVSVFRLDAAAGRALVPLR
jgi:methyl-accepting chemotaxis protein